MSFNKWTRRPQPRQVLYKYFSLYWFHINANLKIKFKNSFVKFTCDWISILFFFLLGSNVIFFIVTWFLLLLLNIKIYLLNVYKSSLFYLSLNIALFFCFLNLCFFNKCFIFLPQVVSSLFYTYPWFYLVPRPEPRIQKSQIKNIFIAKQSKNYKFYKTERLR